MLDNYTKQKLLDCANNQYMDRELLDEIANCCKYCILKKRWINPVRDVIQFILDLLFSVQHMTNFEDLIMCNPLKLLNYCYFEKFINTFTSHNDLFNIRSCIHKLKTSRIIANNEWMDIDLEELNLLCNGDIILVQNTFVLPNTLATYTTKNFEMLPHELLFYNKMSRFDMQILLYLAILLDQKDLIASLLLGFNVQCMDLNKSLITKAIKDLSCTSKLDNLVASALLIK